MIRPRMLLVVCSAVVLIPLLSVAVAMPGASRIALTAATVYTLCVLLDLLICLSTKRTIAISLPPVVRCIVGDTCTVPIFITRHHPSLRQLHCTCALPPQIRAATSIVSITLNSEEERPTAQLQVIASTRGKFRLEGILCEYASRLGFFALRSRHAPECEVRVYPDLRQEFRGMAAFLLYREIDGVHARRFFGKGREFEKLREYIPGDSFEDIHWKATAKRNQPITKIFQLERTQHIFVAIDFSRHSTAKTSLGSGQPDVAIAERYIAAALILANAAQRQGDCFGMCTFTESVDALVGPGRGAHHYSICRDKLYTLNPQNLNPDYRDLAARIRTGLKRRSLVFILTHIHDPVAAEELQAAIELISRRHIVVVGVARDDAVQPVFANPVTSTDEIYEHLGNHLVWSRINQTRIQLRKRGVELIQFNPATICRQIVSHYIRIKERQIL
ncbi:MAG: DUF58 domain-containing protein [Chitinivibrionales bacterium]|nr:DUF58 domain-containing protein [Chitinivibrionales bacterium]